jgi:formylmethanofuran dehydrogenase subunit A
MLKSGMNQIQQKLSRLHQSTKRLKLIKFTQFNSYNSDSKQSNMAKSIKVADRINISDISFFKIQSFKSKFIFLILLLVYRQP